MHGDGERDFMVTDLQVWEGRSGSSEGHSVAFRVFFLFFKPNTPFIQACLEITSW